LIWLLFCFVGLRSLAPMAQRLLPVFFSAFVVGAAGAQQYVAFDAASASSTYSAGNLAGSPAFAAQQSLSGGSGYW
jgi:hypothetical protein